MILFALNLIIKRKRKRKEKVANFLVIGIEGLESSVSQHNSFSTVPHLKSPSTEPFAQHTQPSDIGPPLSTSPGTLGTPLT